MTSAREVGLLRLAAQRVAGPGWDTPAEAVGWATATQAQDFRGALESVALRTAGGTAADVVAALDAGEVVRSWPMRGTLHLVRAEDLLWVLSLTTERLITGAASRRAELGLDDALIERARDLAVGALSGGRRLSREGLRTVWEAAGVAADGQRTYHLIWYLAQTGTLCWGPVDDGEQHLVLLDEWVPAPRVLEREEALGELALRYFRGHGPATVKDFIWWTKLRAAEARAGVALARPRLETLSVDGTEMLMDPGTPERLATHRAEALGTHLLPGFDEFLLGYQDRSAVLAPEFAARVVPGGNGVFQRTVVDAGAVVGTWRRSGKGARAAVAATPFTAFSPRALRAIERRSAALTREHAG
ncbi:winged helix DNA-binding domain-containing protein [Georgenia wangjunii]|uniref:winged helix DNA-binding domain-containing protein n=1 Tax=Georgenia wangjunii TaxID=3117730 RepID=UPI002F26C858